MEKLKEIGTNWRVILIAVLVVLSLWLIFFDGASFGPTNEGAAIRGIVRDSAADVAGFIGADANVRPLSREVITAVDGQIVSSAADFYALVSDVQINDSVVIRTNQRTLEVVVQPEIITLNETEIIFEDVFNETTNTTEQVSREVPRTEFGGPAELGFIVYDAPTTNIRQGLDLQGGTRILLSPEDEITPDDFETIRTNLEQRLNVFGLSDLSVTVVQNIQFQPEFIMIEIAGSTVRDVEELVLSQGRFEGKVGNVTVFTGDDRDITLKRGPAESGIQSCSRAEEGVFCSFFFNVRLSTEAARRQAAATQDLEIISSGTDSYLSEDLDLYLDGTLVDSLRISSNLRGRELYDVMITGSGEGLTQREAQEDAVQNMRVLRSVIETGSLPSTLEIIKADSISPLLGRNFLINALIVALGIIIAVGVILLFVYRKPVIIIPMMLSLVVEVILILGSSILINWTLDLAAIAGILLIMGTGIDHLIVITDGVLKRTAMKEVFETWKSRLKKALYIIIGAYLTTVVAMLPLMAAGAGLLRGFAITTIIGLTFGVFITRPAYAKVIEVLLQ